MDFHRILIWLRRVNVRVALAVGIVLLLTVCLILADIVLRQVGMSFGGSDEISGYVMAVTASWGLSYALLELAHVRIDLMRLRLRTFGRCVLDILSILAVTMTTLVIAFQTWPVLAKSLARDSHANTPLETPLWIPQAIWFAGWVWFAATASLMLFCAIGLLWRSKIVLFDEFFGTRSEVEAIEADPASHR